METAIALYEKYGIKRVTMDMLAKELGMSKKTIYQYFKDKDAVVYETTKMNLDRSRIGWETLSEKAENAIQEIYYISQMVRERLLHLNASLLFDLERYHPNTFILFQEYQEIYKELMKNTLKRGIEEKYFRPNMDVEVLARLRILETQIPFNPQVYPPHEFDYKEVQWQLTEHFVMGLVTDEGKKLLDSYQKNPIG